MAKNAPAYYTERNERLISFDPRNIEIKKRMVAAARKDNRSLNGWIEHYILPRVEKLLDEQMPAEEWNKVRHHFEDEPKSKAGRRPVLGYPRR